MQVADAQVVGVPLFLHEGHVAFLARRDLDREAGSLCIQRDDRRNAGIRHADRVLRRGQLDDRVLVVDHLRDLLAIHNDFQRRVFGQEVPDLAQRRAGALRKVHEHDLPRCAARIRRLLRLCRRIRFYRLVRRRVRLLLRLRRRGLRRFGPRARLGRHHQLVYNALVAVKHKLGFAFRAGRQNPAAPRRKPQLAAAACLRAIDDMRIHYLMYLPVPLFRQSCRYSAASTLCASASSVSARGRIAAACRAACAA